MSIEREEEREGGRERKGIEKKGEGETTKNNHLGFLLTSLSLFLMLQEPLHEPLLEKKKKKKKKVEEKERELTKRRRRER